MRLRKTAQLQMMQKELEKMKGFFSAYEFHESLIGRNIGIATVYRFLGNLADSGKIHNYNCGTSKVYSTTSKNHTHFRCERCGVISHISVPKLNLEGIKGQICHLQLDITGVCERCLQKKD